MKVVASLLMTRLTGTVARARPAATSRYAPGSELRVALGKRSRGR